MKTESYSQALERLQKIVSQIESGELEIDQLAEKIKEANDIIAFCNEKLTKADEEIKKLSQEKQWMLINFANFATNYCKWKVI